MIHRIERNPEFDFGVLYNQHLVTSLRRGSALVVGLLVPSGRLGLRLPLPSDADGYLIFYPTHSLALQFFPQGHLYE